MKYIYTPILVLFTFIIAAAQKAEPCEKISDRLIQYNKILPAEKVYIHTDQHYYEPESNIWFKAYVTDAGLQPTQISGQLRVELYDPIGNKFAAVLLEVKEGTANGDFTLSKDAVGGIYTMKAFTGWNRNFSDQPVFEKKLTVQRYMLPNLLMKLDFMKEKYGPGAEVSAKFEIRSKDDIALSDKKFEYTLELAGKRQFVQQGKTDAAGKAIIVFNLPDDLNTADGILNVLVDHDGRKESITRSVPIMTRKLSLKFFPESGDLVEGFNSKVAFQATDEFGKPADFKAVLKNQKGAQLAAFESYHQGMGAFMLKAQKGDQYTVEIIEPKGIATVYTLPKALPNSVSLRIDRQEKDNIFISVYSPTAQPLCLAVQMQDRIVYDLGIEAKAGENKITIPTNAFPVGIAQIILLNSGEIAETERLVFVNKHRQLNLSISTHRPFYQIRDSVILDIKVTDERGMGVKGDFSMAVVDDKLWTFADDRQDNILSSLLMSSDLKGYIHEPSFYFKPDEAKADSALDFVMLTHGWRRYNWRELMAKEAEAAWQKQRKYGPDPALAIVGQLLRNGKPYANKAIYVKAVNNDSCYRGDKKVMTDQAGNFLINLNELPNCNLLLQTKNRATVYKQNVYPRKNSYYYSNRHLNGVWFEIKPYRMILKEGFGDLQGKVLEENDEPLAFAILKLYQKEVLIKETNTDFDGLYNFSNLKDGYYDLEVRYVGYPIKKITNVLIKGGQVMNYDIRYTSEEIKSVQNLEEVVVMVSAFKMPLIEIDNTTSGMTLGAEDIQKLATRSISSIRATTAGISQKDEGESVNMNGSRATNSNGSRSTTDDTFVDGVRVIGGAQLQASEITILSTPVFWSNETGNETEMRRLRGESGKSYINDRTNDFVNNAEASYNQIHFNITQAGQPEFYSAKTFYAPDYSPYLNALKVGRAGKMERSDFRKTIYWRPFLSTDSSGAARLHFFNSDAVTTFRIIMEGIGQGTPGRTEKTYAVKMPFEIDVKMPKMFSFGDTARVQLILKNTTQQELAGKLSIRSGNGISLLDTAVLKEYKIPSENFIKVELPLLMLPIKGKQQMLLSFDAAGISDEIVLDFESVSRGFPTEVTLSGKELKKSGYFDINAPMEGSFSAKLEVFGNILEDLKSTMEGMIRQPYGCFEQVSSSNYPNILALEYMKRTNTLDPAVYDRAHKFLDEGYKKLAGYESAGGGFEWFGASPAHEGLTAFGLMEFKDMDEVYSGVNSDMTKRALNWLKSRRDGKGSYMSERGYHHGWGNSKAVTDAYITYALSYVGEKDLAKEVAAVTAEAELSKDLYRLGLAVLTNYNVGNSAKADALLKEMNYIIEKMGPENLKAEHSITYSYGQGLKTEILGIAIIANLKSSKPNIFLVNGYIGQLLKNRSYGYFGNTQATVWALKALSAYVIHIGKQKSEDGKLLFFVNGVQVLSQAINTQNVSKLNFDDLGKFLKEGRNSVEIKFEGLSEAVPYSFRAGWSTYKPESSEECPLKIETKMAAAYVKVGDNVRLSATIKNTGKKDAASAMALIGIPAGLSLQPWQLKELLETQKADFYEVIDNYLVLYYRSIKANEEKVLHIDLKAEVPGNYKAPAGSTYQYYGAEHKFWEAGNSIQVIQ